MKTLSIKHEHIVMMMFILPCIMFAGSCSQQLNSSESNYSAPDLTDLINRVSELSVTGRGQYAQVKY